MLIPRQFSIFDIRIDNLSMQDSIDAILNAGAGNSEVAYFVNANSLNQAYENTELAAVLNLADYVFPDGSGIRMAAKRQNISVRENVNGTDMLPLLCKAAIKKNLSVYFLGSTQDTVKRAAKKIKRRFPGIKIAGYHHGYVTPENETAVIESINNSGANILLVGMGTPVQELWIDQNRHQLNTNINIGVGGLFDFYSGRIPRAPLWFRKHGMEWVWRLVQEPKAKFRRYVLGNPLFLLRIALR